MKNISTLVPDMYKLLESGKVHIDAQGLAAAITARLAEDKGAAELRMSNVGTPCDRKLWYSINLPNMAEPLPAPARLKFLIGDITEEVVASIAEQTPGHVVEGRQDTLELHGIQGHRDCVIDGVTVDIKSASSFSFQKFEEGLTPDKDAFGYLDQLNLYREAGRDDPVVTVKGEAAFLAVDKTLGKLTLDRHRANGTDYVKLISQKRGMLAEKVPPKRAYMPEPDGKSGNMKLGTACSYCPFKKECWKNSNGGDGLRTFAYSTGPRFLTHVAREPKPELEVTTDEAAEVNT